MKQTWIHVARGHTLLQLDQNPFELGILLSSPCKFTRANRVVQLHNRNYTEETKMKSKHKTHRRRKLSFLLSLSSLVLLLTALSAQAQIPNRRRIAGAASSTVTHACL